MEATEFPQVEHYHLAKMQWMYAIGSSQISVTICDLLTYLCIP